MFADWSGSSRVNGELIRIEPSAFCVKPNHQQVWLLLLQARQLQLHFKAV